jgi:REP element-mobilizing transposase RayT
MKRRGRRSTRLADYDYSKEGAYFITVCTKNRIQFFSRIKNGKTILSKAGIVIVNLWPALIDKFDGVGLDEYVIMPNHFHGIIHIRRGLINQTPTADQSGSNWTLMKNPRLTLGKIVRHLKANATRIIRKAGNTDFAWQRNYHDRIIRDEKELNAIREYILNNPLKWELDRENPDSVNYGIDHHIYFKDLFG